MCQTRSYRARRRILVHAITMAFSASPLAGAARVLTPGEQYTVFPSTPLETWSATLGGHLTLMPGASTLNIDLQQSQVTATDASIVSTTNASNDLALLVANGSTATLQGGVVSSQFGTGLSVSGVGGEPGADMPSTATVNGTAISGAIAGAVVGNGSTLNATQAQFDGAGTQGVGVVITSGTANLTDGSRATGEVNGAKLTGDSRGGDVPSPGRFLVVDGSVVAGRTGAAVLMEVLRPADTQASVSVVNGGTLIGGNGIAIDIGARVVADVHIADSTVEGGIRANDTATARLALDQGAVLRGWVTGAGITATVDPTAAWVVTGDSSIKSLQLDGALAFSGSAGYRTATITGDLTGSGGVVTVNTRMDSGGALALQGTDRLLVLGDVATTGTTLVDVIPTGEGALTDLNKNGAVDASEGISIIQVAGASRADAFALKGTYVAAGPYQYTLHAFGPGATDPTQNALPGGAPVSWDYRLGNRYVSDCGDHCEPVNPPVDPTDPVDPPPQPDPSDRPALVPQLPSYLVASLALQNYGSLLSDGLHQRLGEIRDSVYGANVGGEVFARYLGGQLNYSRNLSFQRYGYDFDQQINALQVGGGIVDVDNDAGSLRAGWALDSGTTRVTPSAADGNSRAKYYANGGSAWITWQHGASALWVDGVIGVTRYHGDVSTDLRGEDVGKVRAQGWSMSVETGLPLPLGGDWVVEPQFQVRLERLDFSDFRDKDGLDIRVAASTQTTSRLGVRFARIANPVFAPYGRFDVMHTGGGHPTVQASSESWDAGDVFETGRVGNSYRVAAGVTSQLTDHVQVYGQGSLQQALGGYGLRGWAASAGVRVTF
jgi:outer membrane autotransporter protein